MKLIFAVINNDDSRTVSDELIKGGFSVTKLASTGGFLMEGNTTFLICVEAGLVDQVIEIIRRFSRKRTQTVPVAAAERYDNTGTFPREVTLGGAAVFVTDVERFEKL